ncbi:hypothetical protein RBH29_05220 [Herbivorax sp. ANBcel31]|uniref:hypothetical protein n=1 Tax=Herbivorax sp. ANBcel31 TaxID=3069754 RepID=UPI0027B58E0F|nr:hypothetical protein [Herbivorax sp. ANBcel31]MDQ2085836.1 hypothetical protein [Herbivorax sp. ANBcel31]
MNKKLKLLTLSMALVVTMSSITGCDLPFGQDDVEEQEPLPPLQGPDASVQEDEQVQEFLGEYFSDMFAVPVEDYTENLVKGIVPENIFPYIASRTIDEGNENPEVPIHMPRKVSMGNLVLLDYDLLEHNNSPMIDATYIGQSGDAFAYYVKVDVAATGLPHDVFGDNYIQRHFEEVDDDELDEFNTVWVYEFEENSDEEKAVTDEDYDRIKVQLRYDVEVIIEGGSYKVLTQLESVYRPRLRDRVHILNHEFVRRIPYLDMSINDESTVYERERGLIESFYNNLLKLDRERMALLRKNWDLDYLDFMEFISSTGISGGENPELLLVDEDYKEKFNIMAFPLQPGMRRLTNYEVFNVTIHPAYSQKNKLYFVRFVAGVERASDIGLGNRTMYYYDYVVTLDDQDGNLQIDSIKLNEFYETSNLDIIQQEEEEDEDDDEDDDDDDDDDDE